MKIRDIIIGIFVVMLAASNWYFYNAYHNEVDGSSALQLKIELRDQQIAGMNKDLERCYSELEEINGSSRHSNYGTERENQEIIQEKIGGEIEWRLDDGTRIDLVLEEPNKRTVEIDWCNKWAEGVGQAIYYMMKLNAQNIEIGRQNGIVELDPNSFYQPMVILLAKGQDSGWEKYRDRVEFCRMRCWVFDAATKTWLDKED